MSFSELEQTSSWDQYRDSNLLSLPTNYYTPLNMSSSGHQETWEDEIEDSSLIRCLDFVGLLET